MIVGLSAAGGGEEDKTGAESGEDEMAETHWAIPPLTSEGTQSGYYFIPKKIEAIVENRADGFLPHSRRRSQKRRAMGWRVQSRPREVRRQRSGIVKFRLGPTGSG